MPQQVAGRMRGFQLWINLPAKEKMKPASYRDIDPSEIPLVALPGGGRVKVIAGTLDVNGTPTPGPITGGATDALYFDVELAAGAVFSQRVNAGYNAFLYPYEGTLSLGPSQDARTLEARSAGLLSEGDEIVVRAKSDARFLVLAARPLKEPIVQYGPFVMNTREEIDQAIRDYQTGELAKA
jgi:redox-sensitive bicupin YhaK (pirin superfamily)